VAIATINRFIRLFDDAFRQLGAEVPSHDIEVLAMLIHDSMEQGRRVYHTSDHVFSLCDGMNARQTLATLFHDVVYFQLDGGFPRRASGVLKRVTRSGGKTVVLRAIDNEDRGLHACAALFGFAPGQQLPLYGGLNEFLSAVVAERSLSPWLKPVDVIAILACIEATVPFRGAATDGREPAEVLGGRIREVARILDVSLQDDEIDRILHDAIVLGNHDVGSFAAPDPGVFLSNTWQLIEESNAPLAAVGVYSVREYRSALTRMEGFLSTLNPDHIFHRYRGLPSESEFAAMQEAARRNIAFAGSYLGAKITTMAVIEALAVATGGDCPVSMLLGDIHGPDGGSPARVERYLPAPPQTSAVDARLLSVLETGRTKESGSDLTVSPLTAFVYRSLGHDGTARARAQAARMFSGKLSARDFLATLDRTMVSNVTRACAEIALSRRETLLAVEAHL
jgi:hypothetical protein